MLDPVAGARPAVVARCPAAVLEPDLVEGVAPVLPQEVLVETDRQVVPGQHLVLGAMAMGVPVDGQAGPLGGVDPEVAVEVFAPLLEGAAAPPDVLDHGAQSSVAPAEQAFDQRGLGVVPLVLHAPVAAEIVA